MRIKEQGKRIVRLFFSFFKIGLLTIGGGMAMVPFVEQMVLKEKWLEQEEMTDCIAVSQALPGVIAVNMATYVGRKRMGMAGALIATIGVTLPSFVIILILAYFLNQIGEKSHLQGALMGIRAGVCGLIGVTFFRMGKRVLCSPFSWLVALGTFVAIIFAHISAALVVVVALFSGIIYGVIKERRKTHGG